jgi:hypothetical protein
MAIYQVGDVVRVSSVAGIFFGKERTAHVIHDVKITSAKAVEDGKVSYSGDVVGPTQSEKDAAFYNTIDGSAPFGSFVLPNAAITTEKL